MWKLTGMGDMGCLVWVPVEAWEITQSRRGSLSWGRTRLAEEIRGLGVGRRRAGVWGCRFGSVIQSGGWTRLWQRRGRCWGFAVIGTVRGS